jgi:hypothetical protein
MFIPHPPPGEQAPLRRILRRVRRRLHALPFLERPADLHALLTAAEAQALARSGAYPLPPAALAWLTESPAARSRRRERWARRIAAVVRSVLADELPEAIDYLLGRKP